jgi:hypothetical protein
MNSKRSFWMHLQIILMNLFAIGLLSFAELSELLLINEPFLFISALSVWEWASNARHHRVVLISIIVRMRSRPWCVVVRSSSDPHRHYSIIREIMSLHFVAQLIRLELDGGATSCFFFHHLLSQIVRVSLLHLCLTWLFLNLVVLWALHLGWRHLRLLSDDPWSIKEAYVVVFRGLRSMSGRSPCHSNRWHYIIVCLIVIILITLIQNHALLNPAMSWTPNINKVWFIRVPQRCVGPRFGIRRPRDRVCSPLPQRVNLGLSLSIQAHDSWWNKHLLLFIPDV